MGQVSDISTDILNNAFSKLLIYNKITAQITAEYLCSNQTIGKLAKKYKISVRSTYRRIKEGREFLREQLEADQRIQEIRELENINEKFPQVNGSNKPNRS